ncbi:unnamed protein product [Lymnaea stagnalis]|uniref:BHLH domain-containing protein n=1 Tax=Lymnaea stagnalis TaxID=6523 RepID=A0AAV2HLL2_LYMST
MAVDDIRPISSQNRMLDIKEERSPSLGASTSTIHSGHFMVSRVHDVNNDDEDEEEIPSPFNDDSKGYDFLSANKETSKTYDFGNENSQATVAIDASLTKLFECMTLAYSGKITSPRWKQFRGLHVSQKQRIRLNNLIWREWHMQYIYQKAPMVCQFACPLSDDVHSKPEAVVLEGKYWKRRLDTVTAEYKKWRRYFKERIRQQQCIPFQDSSRLNENELLERVREVTFIPHSSGSYMSNTDLNLLQSDIMDMDFTNELFASLNNQPFAFPNPRELSNLSCADLIQPGLVQLQPNLEEFMDIDSMQELLNARIPTSFSSTFLSDTSSSVEMGQGNMNSNEMSLVDFLTSSSMGNGVSSTPSDAITSFATTVFGGSNNINNIQNNNFLTASAGPSHNITFQLTSDNGQYHLDPNTIVLGPSQNINTTQQTFTIVPSGIYQNFGFTNTSQSQKPVATAITSDLLAQMLQQQRPQQDTPVLTRRQTQQPTPTLLQSIISSAQTQQHQQNLHQQQSLFQQPSPSSMSPILAQSLSVQHQPHAMIRPSPTSVQRKSNKINKVNNNSSGNSDSASGVISGLARMAGSAMPNNKKKDGPFAVPTVKPVNTPRKNRVIAPAPSQPPLPQAQLTTPVSSPSMQASYLAELLKNGTYPGALISVKKEPPQTQHIPVPSSPIKTTTNQYQQIRPNYNNSAIGRQINSGPGQQMNTGISQQVTSANLGNITTANQIQVSLPLITGTTVSAIDVSSMTNQELTDAILSNSLANINPATPPAMKDLGFRFSPKAESEAALSISPSSTILQKSPDSSPLMVKRSPSPPLSMDTSSLMEPVSPYSSMPMSPSMGMPDSPGSGDSAFSKDPRRAAHLSAEQKRRCNLKTGFDMLQQLVPSLSQNPKVSKATMLQKTAEFCKKLKAERLQMQKEAAILKKEIDTLNTAISTVQSQLPETGVPVTRQRKDQMKEMFDEYVRVRTTENWKFWIFSVIMNTLYDSYCNTVSTASIDDLCRTSLTWLDQSCSLVTLRPNVLNALRRLSTTTSILTEPQKVREQALQAVSKQSRSSNNMMTK